MADQSNSIAYVRSEEAPLLPAPPSTVGVQGWLRKNLFSTPLYSLLTVVLGAWLLWYIWGSLQWGLFTAVWTGADREACLGENVGACWPMVWEKFPQWIYGFYPIEQRWRVNIVYVMAFVSLVPMLMPSAPHKTWNALFLLIVFPLLTLILLTGGNFDFGVSGYATIVLLGLLAAVALPLVSWGIEEGVGRNRLGLMLAGAAIVLWLLSLFFQMASWNVGGYGVSPISLVMGLLIIAAGIVSILAARGGPNGQGLAGWAIGLAAILIAMILLDLNFGLEPVETTQWGGLLVTLVVSVTGIVVSLPLGILLALGRRSQMPIVKLFSVIFIELWRGVPLITVLVLLLGDAATVPA